MMIGAVLGSFSSDKETSTSSQAANTPASVSSQQPTPEPTPSVYKVGDRVVVGNIAYTVNNVRTTDTVGNEYVNGKADGIFVIVDMTLENLGKESDTVTDDYVKIVDSQGRVFKSDNKNWVYLDDNLMLKQIQPGLPSKGQAIFDVPKGITCNLQVTDSFWGTDTKLISIGTT